LKITAIDPFSIKEDRTPPVGPKDKPKVEPAAESKLDPVSKDGGGGRLFDIIEEAKKRRAARGKISDRRKRVWLATYTLVLNGFRGLHDRGKKLDTKI
jgi:hypothetical protein